MLMMLAVVPCLSCLLPADAHDAGRGSGSGLPALRLMLMMLAVVRVLGYLRSSRGSGSG